MILKDYIKNNYGFAYIRSVSNKTIEYPIVISDTNNWVINLQNHCHIDEYEWEKYEVVRCYNVKISGEHDKFPTTSKTRIPWEIKG